MNFDEWLEAVANKAPELKVFIQKLEGFFENERFKAAEFEKEMESKINAAGNAAFEAEGASSND